MYSAWAYSLDSVLLGRDGSSVHVPIEEVHLHTLSVCNGQPDVEGGIRDLTEMLIAVGTDEPNELGPRGRVCHGR